MTNNYNSSSSRRKHLLSILIPTTVLLVLIGIGIGVRFTSSEFVPQGTAAVTAISETCAIIGRDVLRDNGSAVDAALASLFCETVSTPQSMGLGGGFVGIVYQRSERRAHSIIAREVAPAAASRDMFNNVSRVEGIQSFAVPGELRGYAELHRRFGQLSWRRIIQPAIDMCRNGYPITPILGRILHLNVSELVQNTATFREIFWNEAENRLVREGELVKRLQYAETLELIAAEGVATMYEPNGTVAKRLIADVRELGGLVTLDDLSAYRASWDEPDQATIFGDKKLFTTPLPASGSVLVFIMNILEDFLPQSLGLSVKFYHRLMEAFKFGYAKRVDLGDPQFVPAAAELSRNLTNRQFAQFYRSIIDDTRTYNETQHYGTSHELAADHGTAHVSVLAANGDAVAITSSVNIYFGCKIISPRTGIVLNNQMDDFSVPGKSNFYGLPASPANFIAPGKRPMSSMCPAIVANGAGDVEMVIGAAGGTRITTAVAMMMIRHLKHNMTLYEAMITPRIHHQLLPMRVMHEISFDTEILNELRSLGHGLELTSEDNFGALFAISRHGDRIEAVSEIRRNGSVAIL